MVFMHRIFKVLLYNSMFWVRSKQTGDPELVLELETSDLCSIPFNLITLSGLMMSAEPSLKSSLLTPKQARIILVRTTTSYNTTQAKTK